jgi:hypothetical protein
MDTLDTAGLQTFFFSKNSGAKGPESTAQQGFLDKTYLHTQGVRGSCSIIHIILIVKFVHFSLTCPRFQNFSSENRFPVFRHFSS